MTNAMVVDLIIKLVQLVLVPAIVFAISMAAKYLKGKAKGEKVRHILDLADTLMQVAVDQTAQTFVDEMKRAEKFDKEAIAKANERTMNTFVQLLGEKGYVLLNESMANSNDYLKALMESKVRGNK